ncbi:XAC0095 family protein [Dyella flava]|uniref:XAC0095 family protein n=1 Tax=Dyella flava TaxID=1920170 RepID=UPI0035EE1CAB
MGYAALTQPTNYIELKNLQHLLMIMANVGSDEESHTDEDGTVMIPRWEMQLTFQLISRLIGEALEHLEKRHHIEPRSPMQH